jgi:hypothetical protein
MIYYLTKCEETSRTQLDRLRPARALLRDNIPCVVWAEDALSFVHCVPTSLSTLQLLVPDTELQSAASNITTTLPYIPAGSHPRFFDGKSDPGWETRYAFPRSLYLKLKDRYNSMRGPQRISSSIHNPIFISIPPTALVLCRHSQISCLR